MINCPLMPKRLPSKARLHPLVTYLLAFVDSYRLMRQRVGSPLFYGGWGGGEGDPRNFRLPPNPESAAPRILGDGSPGNMPAKVRATRRSVTRSSLVRDSR